MHKTDINVILLESVNYFTRYFVKVHKIIAVEKICNSSSRISAKILSEAADPGGKRTRSKWVVSVRMDLQLDKSKETSSFHQFHRKSIKKRELAPPLSVTYLNLVLPDALSMRPYFANQFHSNGNIISMVCVNCVR